MKVRTGVRAALFAALGSSAGIQLAHAQEAIFLEEIIVTAQKRAESISDVPIAVSAFSSADLENQRIDGAYNLQTAVPNLVFSGGVGPTPNFSIRGVGAANAGSTGDSGVLPHHNNVPLTSSRLGTSDFYDVERIEVLRGPQGTLYGRNATGGVINVITNKPDIHEFSASLQADVGNYATRKAKGHVNFAAGDMVGFRLAGSYLEREGYTYNQATNSDIDSRDIWSTRASLLIQPSDAVRVSFMYERFEEDDTRNGGTKELCIKDPGPTSVGGVPVNDPRAQEYLSRGCQQGSVYDPRAFGTVNSVATFGGVFASAPLPVFGPMTTGDTFAGQTTSRDLRHVNYYRAPLFQATNDLFEFETEWDINDGLTLSVLASYTTDESYLVEGSQQSAIGFNDTAITPGGVFVDPQGGPGAGVRTLRYIETDDKQYTGELRLQSNFEGPLNFNAGLFYLDLDRLNNTFVSTNATNAYRAAMQLIVPGGAAPTLFGYLDTTPGIPVSGAGHNYFLSHNPYELQSQAVFTELYWQATDTLKFTLGARYTEDEKSRDNYPILLFQPLGQGGVPGAPGWNEASIRHQVVSFEETTGRLAVDWQPTDDTLVYASFARGYKAGGFNSPTLTGAEVPYDSELVDSFELGTKNLFFDGRLQLNLTGFFYDYQDYQYGKIEGFQATNDNLDVEVKGVELEVAWSPIAGLRFNGQFGYLDTEIQEGSSIDPFDRTQGDPTLSYAKSINGGCVVNTAGLAALVGAINAGAVPAVVLSGLPGLGFTPICNGGFDASFGLNAQPGVAANLKGNSLPYSPEWTASVGAQYTFSVGGDWEMTVRGDYYKQADSFTSHFNGDDYALKSWENYNASLIIANQPLGLEIQVYGKNLADDDVIVGFGAASEQVGLVRNVQLLEPRLFGVVLTKRW